MYTNANSRLSIPGGGALRLSGLPNPQAARTSSASSRVTANALPGLQNLPAIPGSGVLRLSGLQILEP
ncbi:hypothetical protein [Klebsiella oxytoca]|uniref:hypothetical protein n=1 Tax=Klebsiella oxytoca TaxID=571 RepID=UPI0039C8C867